MHASTHASAWAQTHSQRSNAYVFYHRTLKTEMAFVRVKLLSLVLILFTDGLLAGSGGITLFIDWSVEIDNLVVLVFNFVLFVYLFA